MYEPGDIADRELTDVLDMPEVSACLLAGAVDGGLFEE